MNYRPRLKTLFMPKTIVENWKLKRHWNVVQAWRRRENEHQFPRVTNNIPQKLRNLNFCSKCVFYLVYLSHPVDVDS